MGGGNRERGGGKRGRTEGSSGKEEGGRRSLDETFDTSEPLADNTEDAQLGGKLGPARSPDKLPKGCWEARGGDA